jgi:DNA-binding HxlR family transcriptional regulator
MLGVPEVAMDSPDGMAWPEIMKRLEILRRQWDLAIIVTVHAVPGIRAGELLRRVNNESPARRLAWKVLAERLDWLADEGYVTRRVTADGRGTRYWLCPRGFHVLSAARIMTMWLEDHERSCWLLTGSDPANIMPGWFVEGTLGRASGLLYRRAPPPNQYLCANLCSQSCLRTKRRS